MVVKNLMVSWQDASSLWYPTASSTFPVTCDTSGQRGQWLLLPPPQEPTSAVSKARWQLYQPDTTTSWFLSPAPVQISPWKWPVLPPPPHWLFTVSFPPSPWRFITP